MFTAMILICAGAIKDPELCYVNVHDNLFQTQQECQYTIFTSLQKYPELFEWHDETLDKTWKVTDWNCVNWKAIKI